MSFNPKILIVGQGIAGTVLHFSFFQRGINAELISTLLPGNASSAAAGIINPITGPKYQKSWKYDELMEVFTPFYTDLERTIGHDFFHKMRMYRYLPGLNQINKWIKRWDDVVDSKFYGEFVKTLEGYPEYEGEGTWGEIYNAFRVDFNLLINAYAAFLQKEDLLRNDVFNFEQLKVDKDQVTYSDAQYDHIIFCEGYRLMENPYFNYLPLIPAKGEALLIHRKIDNEVMMKRNELMTQWDESNIWYGATLQNSFDSIGPDHNSANLLIGKYNNDFNLTPIISGHLSGLRPTVSDRKPLIGLHSEYKSLCVFNGMGTKGASLAPLMATFLVQKILENIDIPAEVDIQRFRKEN